MKRLLVLTITLTLFACAPKQSETHWQLALKTDKEGNTLAGSREQLINAIRKGASVKIGWGAIGKTHRIEHLSEPIWIAVLDEQEVVAHLDPQVLAKTDWEALTANYADSTLARLEWRVVLSTKGEFDAIWYDRKDHRISERRPQNHMMSWFVKDIDLDSKGSPLFEE